MLSFKHSWTLEYHYEFSCSIYYSPNLPAGPNQLKHLLNEFCFLKPCCKSETETVTHLWSNPINFFYICFCCIAILLSYLISQKFCKHFFSPSSCCLLISERQLISPSIITKEILDHNSCQWLVNGEAKERPILLGLVNL